MSFLTVTIANTITPPSGYSNTYSDTSVVYPSVANTLELTAKLALTDTNTYAFSSFKLYLPKAIFATSGNSITITATCGNATVTQTVTTLTPPTGINANPNLVVFDITITGAILSTTNDLTITLSGINTGSITAGDGGNAVLEIAPTDGYLSSNSPFIGVASSSTAANPSLVDISTISTTELELLLDVNGNGASGTFYPSNVNNGELVMPVANTVSATITWPGLGNGVQSNNGQLRIIFDYSDGTDLTSNQLGFLKNTGNGLSVLDWPIPNSVDSFSYNNSAVTGYLTDWRISREDSTGDWILSPAYGKSIAWGEGFTLKVTFKRMLSSNSSQDSSTSSVSLIPYDFSNIPSTLLPSSGSYNPPFADLVIGILSAKVQSFTLDKANNTLSYEIFGAPQGQLSWKAENGSDSYELSQMATLSFELANPASWGLYNSGTCPLPQHTGNATSITLYAGNSTSDLTGKSCAITPIPDGAAGPPVIEKYQILGYINNTNGTPSIILSWKVSNLTPSNGYCSLDYPSGTVTIPSGDGGQLPGSTFGGTAPFVIQVPFGSLASLTLTVNYTPNGGALTTITQSPFDNNDNYWMPSSVDLDRDLSELPNGCYSVDTNNNLYYTDINSPQTVTPIPPTPSSSNNQLYKVVINSSSSYNFYSFMKSASGTDYQLESFSVSSLTNPYSSSRTISPTGIAVDTDMGFFLANDGNLMFISSSKIYYEVIAGAPSDYETLDLTFLPDLAQVPHVLAQNSTDSTFWTYLNTSNSLNLQQLITEGRSEATLRATESSAISSVSKVIDLIPINGYSDNAIIYLDTNNNLIFQGFSLTLSNNIATITYYQNPIVLPVLSDKCFFLFSSNLNVLSIFYSYRGQILMQNIKNSEKSTGYGVSWEEPILSYNFTNPRSFLNGFTMNNGDNNIFPSMDSCSVLGILYLILPMSDTTATVYSSNDGYNWSSIITITGVGNKQLSSTSITTDGQNLYVGYISEYQFYYIKYTLIDTTWCATNQPTIISIGSNTSLFRNRKIQYYNEEPSIVTPVLYNALNLAGSFNTIFFFNKNYYVYFNNNTITIIEDVSNDTYSVKIPPIPNPPYIYHSIYSNSAPATIPNYANRIAPEFAALGDNLVVFFTDANGQVNFFSGKYEKDTITWYTSSSTPVSAAVTIPVYAVDYTIVPLLDKLCLIYISDPMNNEHETYFISETDITTQQGQGVS